MMALSSGSLPPNPYTRKPITRSERLAGRGAELESVEYYLRLTATSDSPHLALIGPRGVGKTSLLNSIEDLARRQRLAPLRIDLDEHKTSAPGIFWQNFYASLLLAAADATCWGGPLGPIYAAQFQMIHARKLAAIPDIVLQFAAVLAASEGPLETLSCPDVLIHRDLTKMIAELRNQGYLGLAILIDEGDLLGQNRPLIQMFRNIFQRLDASSLVLAGTEAVFSTLTEVFSPIPRQFHRIDVTPFRNWVQTHELVSKPFETPPYTEHKHVLPASPVVHALHDLCSGDPAELQLYSHHMYKLVERGLSEKMELQPQLFREVAREFRAFASADIGDVLAKIERLPDKLLFGSRWLQRRRITLEDNVELAILEHELKGARQLAQDEVQAIRGNIEEGYATLCALGITNSADRIDLVGDTLTASFWKSYVEAEKHERWFWVDSSMLETLPGEVAAAVDASPDRHMALPVLDDNDGIGCLIALRAGEMSVNVTVADLVDLLAARVVLDSKNQEVGTDATLSIVYRGRTSKWSLLYTDRRSPGDAVARLEMWLLARAHVLERHGVQVTIDRARSWPKPTNVEMQRSAYIVGLSLPEENFGTSPMDEAMAAFSTGNIAGAIEQFTWMAEHKAADNMWNNIAYCNMLLGDYAGAGRQFERMKFLRSDESWPIYKHNRALLACLTDNRQGAHRMLKEAIDWIREAGTKFQPRSALCMLLLARDGKGVTSKDKLPIDAAIFLNLFILGGISMEDLVTELSRRYPDEWDVWVAWVRGVGQ